MTEMAQHPLAIALQAAVPLRIGALQRLPDEEFAALFDHGRLAALAQTVGEHGDDLLFRSAKPGASAAMFTLVADAIAALSYCPGGIDIFGLHFEATREDDA